MPDFSVPGAVRPPASTLDGKMILMYGEPKIGKTTFATDFEGAWVIATEKGQDFVSVRPPTEISSWKQFREFVTWLYQTKPLTFGDGQPIKWLVIDRIDDIHRLCNEEVVKSLGVEDCGELGHGKGWSRLRTEFLRVMSALRSLPYGMICISHERAKEVVSAAKKITRREPNIGAAGYQWAVGASDLILYAFSQEVPEKDPKGQVTGKIITKRVMLCHPSAGAVAGGRMAEILPPLMPLSAAELQRVIKDRNKSAAALLVEDVLTTAATSPTP